MPVKRRTSKRRINPAVEYQVWESIFDAGTDFFDELADIGVASDPYGTPDNDCARAAWGRHGARYVAEHGRQSGSGRMLWALEQFGQPAHAG